MTSLADVAAQLRHIAEQLPIPQIGEAADHAEAAATILAEAFAGTAQPDFVEATDLEWPGLIVLFRACR